MSPGRARPLSGAAVFPEGGGGRLSERCCGAGGSARSITTGGGGGDDDGPASAAILLLDCGAGGGGNVGDLRARPPSGSDTPCPGTDAGGSETFGRDETGGRE